MVGGRVGEGGRATVVQERVGVGVGGVGVGGVGGGVGVGVVGRVVGVGVGVGASPEPLQTPPKTRKGAQKKQIQFLRSS